MSHLQCTVPGCSRPLRYPKYGICGTHYQLYRRNGVPARQPRMNVEQRFYSYVTMPNGPLACWGWTGAPDRHGYGSLNLRKNSQKTNPIKAHRISYEIHYGPIPDGLYVCHHCDNPPCCNPAHLFLGTHQDNVADMWQKGRGKTWSMSGDANPKAVLNPEAARLILDEYRAGATQPQLALKYGVSQGTISHVTRLDHWAIRSSV
jgi:hypothetical protein